MTIFKNRLLGLASIFSVLPLLLTAEAHAQAVERHLPDMPTNAPAQITAPNAVPNEQDPTPIGPDLRAIVLLGSQETVKASASDGVSVSDLIRLKADGKIIDILQPFLGHPLSRKLIAEIEAAIARHYRDINYPFISLSTPEQEITTGTLQIRIVEFTTGKIGIDGTTSKAEVTRLRKHVHLEAGDAVNARRLTYDLDWINRYPFRNVQAVFSPGSTIGVSDLTLTAREGKPWQVYTGYSNDGSPSTGFDRYFAGGAIGGLLGNDSVLAVQTTVSRDVVAGDKNPRYRSAALNYTLPAGWHGQVEASADVVETYQPGNPFAVRLKASEGALGYRFATSDLYGDNGETDVRYGIEAKHQTGITYFSGLNVYEVSVEVYQLYLGYHHTDSDPLGVSTFDASLHLSPGGVDNGNSDAQAILYSQGRQKGATYGYLSATYSRVTLLPAGLSLKTQAIGQFSPIALPRTEQAGLGGSSLVRGYTLDNGAFDAALVVRNELHFPGKNWGVSSQVNPFLFADLGFGRDNALHQGRDLASGGAGADVHLTRNVMLSLSAACALTRDNATKPGDWLAHTNLSLAF